MTFESEEVRHKFHALSAQRQHEYCELEIFLARMQKVLHVKDVIQTKDELNILVRIDEKS